MSRSAPPSPALLLVGPLPPPAGGMANQCAQLRRLLEGDAVAVEFVQTNAPYRPSWLGRIPGLRALARFLPYIVELWRAAGRVDVMHVMANSGWSWHLFAAPAVWIGWVRGIRVIVNYRGGNADAFFRKSGWRSYVTLRRADILVTPSQFLREVFSRHGFDAVVVPNIIDLSRFQATARRDFRDAPHLIVTRNLEPIYDIPTAVRAFARIREVFRYARLTIAGSGPELTRLQEMVGQMGLAGSVHFAGRIDNAEIPRLYATADCMLNPSTVDNMPISILEALASAVPVVSTRAGGIPQMVTHEETALLVGVGDAEGMATQAVRVLSDAQLAGHLTQAGQSMVSGFGWSVVRSRWLDIYSGRMTGLAATDGGADA